MAGQVGIEYALTEGQLVAACVAARASDYFSEFVNSQIAVLDLLPEYRDECLTSESDYAIDLQEFIEWLRVHKKVIWDPKSGAEGLAGWCCCKDCDVACY